MATKQRLAHQHQLNKAHALRADSPQDTDALIRIVFNGFLGLVEGASFEEQSTCNIAVTSMAINSMAAYDA